MFFGEFDVAVPDGGVEVAVWVVFDVVFVVVVSESLDGFVVVGVVLDEFDECLAGSCVSCGFEYFLHSG